MRKQELSTRLVVSFLLYAMFVQNGLSAEPPKGSSRPQLLVGTGIEDPIGYAYRGYMRGTMENLCGPATNKSVLLCVRRDITGDNREDVLVARRGCKNGRSGNFWDVYVRGDDGFIHVPDVVTIYAGMFHVLTIKKSGEKVIITIRPGGGGQSSVVAIRLRNGKFHETVLAQITWTKEDEDADLIWSQLWDEQTKCTPTETSFCELSQRQAKTEKGRIVPVEDAFPGYYDEE